METWLVSGLAGLIAWSFVEKDPGAWMVVVFSIVIHHTLSQEKQWRHNMRVAGLMALLIGIGAGVAGHFDLQLGR